MEYILKNREVISFTVAAKSVIRVSDGVLWLTSEGDSGDYVLQSGNNFEILCDGDLVMEALVDCTFYIHCPDTLSWQVTVGQSVINHKQFARCIR